ncbi:MAG TPA: PKD domain-containing protein [Opitutaceae bacterium]|nr:PKD domain-containing protein [Opitutaceae bacterium]
MNLSRLLWGVLAFAIGSFPLLALDRPEVTFKVFQFPADRIPRVDGEASDWDIVPDSYAVHADQLIDDGGAHGHPDPATFRLTVKVGWVKGLNRLFFLYQATKGRWDFASSGLPGDIFEVVVDGDASGGPLVYRGRGDRGTQPAGSPADPRIDPDEAHWAIHSVQAQNYHVFTPPGDRDWCIAWGAPTWVKELPYANSACRYNFRSGGAGKLTLEFWLTPFDYAGPEGPQRAVESVLRENKIIGLSWAVIDFGDAPGDRHHFWNLSRHHQMFGDASLLCAFRLMPLEPRLLPAIAAQWSWSVVDMGRRLVAFKDLSVGQVTAWKWDFGDGSSSAEPNPVHAYKRPGSYVVILDVEGPGGHARRSKVWDISLR